MPFQIQLCEVYAVTRWFCLRQSLSATGINIPLQKFISNNHYISLNAEEVTCSEKLLTVPNNIKTQIYLTNYIECENKQSLNVQILDDYGDFMIDDTKLTDNQVFSITKNLYFFPTRYGSRSIRIKYTKTTETGDIIKTCLFNLRICYNNCADCEDKESNENSQYCKVCKENYYFVEGTQNCMSINDMNNTNYYFDGNIFKKCYSNCKTCSGGGSDSEMKCLTCNEGNYLAEPSNCINDITHYYYDSGDNKYKHCYQTCDTCNAYSSESSHECKTCNTGYHFIYNETGKCITQDEKPNNTYLNENNNTYCKCHDRCYSCDQGQSETNTNCKECYKENDKYMYHFIYNSPGHCISPQERPKYTYLDEGNNTVSLCYEKCETCSQEGNITNMNCDECRKDENGKYLFHFKFDGITGNCYEREEASIRNNFLLFHQI